MQEPPFKWMHRLQVWGFFSLVLSKAAGLVLASQHNPMDQMSF